MRGETAGHHVAGRARWDTRRRSFHLWKHGFWIGVGQIQPLLFFSITSPARSSRGSRQLLIPCRSKQLRREFGGPRRLTFRIIRAYAVKPVTPVRAAIAVTTAASSPANGPAAVCLCAAALATFYLWRRLPDLRGTTLTAPAGWVAASLILLTGVELALAFLEPEARWPQSLRFIAAAGSFCPLTAVLGARRPQDRGWQLIVVSLWGVVALPAAEAAVLATDGRLVLSPVRGWCTWGLIGMTLLNYLPTRFALSAVLAAAGQTVLFGRQLPLLNSSGGALGRRRRCVPVESGRRSGSPPAAATTAVARYERSPPGSRLARLPRPVRRILGDTRTGADQRRVAQVRLGCFSKLGRIHQPAGRIRRFGVASAGDRRRAATDTAKPTSPVRRRRVVRQSLFSLMRG